MSTLEGIDAVLSDRLRELGMDYVADVLEGKKQPSASQLMLLRTGCAFPLRQQPGTLLIGGPRDGERVSENPERQHRLAVPAPRPIRSLLPDASNSIFPEFLIYYNSYRAERIAYVDRKFWFYVESSIEIEEAIERLFTNYRSPNSVEQV